MVAYNGVLDALVAVAPKIRRNPAESGGFRRIVDHTYYVLDLTAVRARGASGRAPEGILRLAKLCGGA